jgi:putative ABC transport system permease protein
MRGWRTALRVARREARRAKGRSALVIAMITVPITALTFGAVTYDTFKLTPAEGADRLMGAGTAAVVWPFEEPVEQEPVSTEFWYRPARNVQPAPPKDTSTQRLTALLPPGSRAIPDGRGTLNVRTATGTGSLTTRLLDYTDPMARGLLRQLAGRAPATADEVALTPAAVRRVGAGVGGTVRLADGSRTFQIVGVVEDPAALRAMTIVLHPGALPQAAGDPADQRWLVATPGPLTWAQVRELNTHGVVAISRYVMTYPPSAGERYWQDNRSGAVQTQELGFGVLIGGLTLLEIILLAGPAFAVGARRRRRDLALVAANGGTPAQLRRLVLADGVVLGTLAAAAGVVLGILAAATTRRLVEEHLAHARSGGFRVFPLALAAIVTLAMVTGVLAALVPAWIAARQDVVTALAGRRGITRSRRRWVVVGAGLVAAGAVVAGAGAWWINANAILGGLVLGELGLVLCTPAIVGLVGRLGRWLPLASRIALRNTSRNRTAAAPAISAVMAAVAGSLAIGVVFVADRARSQEAYQPTGRIGSVAVPTMPYSETTVSRPPSADPIAAAVRGALPVDRIHEIGRATCANADCFVGTRRPPGRDCRYTGISRDLTRAEQRAARRDPRCAKYGDVYYGSLSYMTVIADPDAVGTLTNLPAHEVERATAAIRAGAVLVTDELSVEAGKVTLTITTTAPANNGETTTDKPQERMVSVDAYALPDGAGAPALIMSPATAQSLGLRRGSLVLLVATTRMPTIAELDRLRASLDSIGSGLDPDVVRGPEPAGNRTLIILAIVAGIITLGAAAIATGLAAADGYADLGTLAAVGASPRVRRALSLNQSGVIAGLGSLLGVVAGVGASTAVLYALNRGYADMWPAPAPYPIVVPWLNVGVALLVVPLVAMLGAGLLTRSRLPIERRL